MTSTSGTITTSLVSNQSLAADSETATLDILRVAVTRLAFYGFDLSTATAAQGQFEFISFREGKRSPTTLQKFDRDSVLFQTSNTIDEMLSSHQLTVSSENDPSFGKVLRILPAARYAKIHRHHLK